MCPDTPYGLGKTSAECGVGQQCWNGYGLGHRKSCINDPKMNSTSQDLLICIN